MLDISFLSGVVDAAPIFRKKSVCCVSNVRDFGQGSTQSIISVASGEFSDSAAMI